MCLNPWCVWINEWVIAFGQFDFVLTPKTMRNLATWKKSNSPANAHTHAHTHTCETCTGRDSRRLQTWISGPFASLYHGSCYIHSNCLNSTQKKCDSDTQKRRSRPLTAALRHPIMHMTNVFNTSERSILKERFSLKLKFFHQLVTHSCCVKLSGLKTHKTSTQRTVENWIWWERKPLWDIKDFIFLSRGIVPNTSCRSE